MFLRQALAFRLFSCGSLIALLAGMLTDPFGTNELTNKIIGCAIQVHRTIGPGVFEKVYSECMGYELKEKKLKFELGRPAPLIYKGTPLKAKYYIDIVVENLVVVELKAVGEITELHTRQVLTQLKLTDLPVGLLFNFNAVVLKDGVRRLINPLLKRREAENI